MDASRIGGSKEDPRYSIDRGLAKRVELANDLRNLADEIEAGARIVVEMLTIEHVATDHYVESSFTLRTQAKKR